ncbi:MAG: PGF-pre-PGF domain-containing protein, partial [Methanosarcinaceae archaeon]|nr:PGF-pre-PGF domain-containing protein [Methanosarcinaceae archaeon]
MISVASANYVFQSEWSVSAEGIQSKPAFYDLNGDGMDEIIVSSNDLKLYVLHSNSTLYWSYLLTQSAIEYMSSPDVGDVDGDGYVEIVTGGGYKNRAVSVWHQDGTLKFLQYLSHNLQSSPTLFDIDPDGKKDIIIGCEDNNTYVLNENGLNKAGWPKTSGGQIYSKPAVGNIISDGSPEIVVSSADGKVYAWDKDGNPLAGWPVDIGGVWFGSPIIADINNDGSNEVLVGSNAGGLYALKGDGTDLTGWPATTDQIWYSSPVVGDLDGDTDLETVIASDFYKVYAFHHDGTPVSGWPVDFSSRGNSIASTPALADADHDGRMEVIINTKYDLLYLIDGNGDVLDSISTTAWKGSPNAADIDDDGIIEVVIGSDVIQMFSIINPPPTSSIVSPSNGSVVHNYGNISFVGTGTDDGSIVSYNWVSDVNGTIGSTASIDTPLSVGWHNITFTVKDNNGATNNDSIQMRVNSVPFMTISLPSDQIVSGYGAKISFNGTGTDVDGTISNYNWTSDINGELSNSILFTTTGLSPGIHSISLNGIDNDGAVGSASIQVKVNAPSSSDSGSSSGGGMPAGGSEPIENVVSKDIQREYVVSGEHIKHEFKESVINGIFFDAKTNAGYVTVTIEILKHTSIFVDDFLSGVVYKNLNIWVGGSDYATESNIGNAKISFSVGKNWVSQYHINEDT